MPQRLHHPALANNSLVAVIRSLVRPSRSRIFTKRQVALKEPDEPELQPKAVVLLVNVGLTVAIDLAAQP